MNSFRIDVDVRRALEVLSGSVFAGSDESIRELIANAADSLTQLPITQRLKPEIRLWPSVTTTPDSPGVLQVSDNGIGMTRTETKERLGKIFSSGKENNRDIIGRFGIGFYSCFRLCSEVEVCTRTRTPGDSGTRMRYRGGETMEIEEWPVEKPGTTVALRLLPEHRRMLETETLARIVRHYCSFVPYPIFLRDSLDLLNEMDAPWYHDEAGETQLSEALQRLFEIVEPLAVFPVREDLGASGWVRGVLFVLPAQARTSLRLFSHRVLITDSERVLLPEEVWPFLGGVIDVDDLPIMISRDGVIENTAQAERVRTGIVEALTRGLLAVAARQRKDFRRLMAEHGPAIKATCQRYPDMLRQLRDHFPYRSSLRPPITVPDYLAQRSDHVVVYADDLSAGATLIPLYNRANIEVLYMTDPADRFFRDNWRSGGQRVEFRRLDVDPPTLTPQDDAKPEDTVDRAAVEAVRMLFQSAVDPKLSVELRSMGADSPPGVLALSEQDRQQLQFIHSVRAHQREGRLGELPFEVQRMATSGYLDMLQRTSAQTVILNGSNEVIRQLLSRLQQKPTGSELESLIARFVYGQALLSSGLELTNEKLTEISQGQTTLIATLLATSNQTTERKQA